MSLQQIERRIFARTVLWQPSGGTIIDLPSRHVNSFGGPSESEEYVSLASGDKTTVRRNHRAEIPITNREASLITNVLQRTRCPFKCAFIGLPNTDNWVWLEPTRIQITNPEISPGQLSERVIDIESSVFYPAISQGMGLLESVPWRGTTQGTRNGNNVLRPKGNARSGYEGPLWNVPSGTSVDLKGNADTISSTDSATIKFELPIWDLGITLSNEVGNISGKIEALDWDGNVLDSGSTNLVLPTRTWQVKVYIHSTDFEPHISVNSIQEAYGVLEGRVSPDCSRVSSPIWNEANTVLT